MARTVPINDELYGALAASKTVASGESFRFPAGELDVASQ